MVSYTHALFCLYDCRHGVFVTLSVYLLLSNVMLVRAIDTRK